MEIGLIQMISSDLQQSFSTHSALGALATISDSNGGPARKGGSRKMKNYEGHRLC